MWVWQKFHFEPNISWCIKRNKVFQFYVCRAESNELWINKELCILHGTLCADFSPPHQCSERLAWATRWSNMYRSIIYTHTMHLHYYRFTTSASVFHFGVGFTATVYIYTSCTIYYLYPDIHLYIRARVLVCICFCALKLNSRNTMIAHFASSALRKVSFIQK